ncbi:MAG: hypothetical protein KGJ23_02675 [Euryarchaeota archaeon]|nr:hypothetical protein [Euryarchaeota archaeon]MDE1835502.1 hypothetical protein [Euryarchaeota archaeon]MDE1880395.1 hypothetical protein [Euryarchaeota archaeon]MDE2045783.1 hypothetical protein [Thermoplasmata archaeon]
MTILVLGPSQWLPGKEPKDLEPLRSQLPSAWTWPGSGGLRPLEVRVALAHLLSQRGAAAVVMEAEEPLHPWNSTAKFLELVRKHMVDQYFVYWPFGAARPGLDVEVGFLLLQMGRGELPGDRVVVFYEDDGASRRAASLVYDTAGRMRFSSLEREGRRTRYYPDLVDFGATTKPWKDSQELLERVLAHAGVSD